MRLLLVLLCAGLCYGAVDAFELARSIRDTSLDPAACYRVHDVQLNKDDIHLYFTDGYLIFGKAVGDRPTTAVFTVETEGGDAEVLLMPPSRAERRSLVSYASTPNLEEHFKATVLVFGDGTYEQLMKQIKANPFNHASPEMGAALADEWTSVVRNLSASFEARLMLDLLSPNYRQTGCFFATVSGKELGNFDVIYEPLNPEQITVGQVNSRNEHAFFDIWTSFTAAPFRSGVRKPVTPDFSLKDYRIEATLQPDLLLRVTTKVKVTTSRPGERGIPFDISSRMNVTSATIEGERAEVLQPESLRSNLIRNDGNNLFLVVARRTLEPGREYELEFHHEGAVVADAGNQVYYVGPRGTWYPNFAMQFASYDLIFRYPKDLDLVTPGDIVEDKTDGEWRTTRRVTTVPIRLAGFNLGVYERARVSHSGYTVEVCANRSVENALKPSSALPVVVPASPRLSRRPTQVVNPPPPRVPNPLARLQELANEMKSALEFLSARFGPPALKTIEVSPIPGAFGQGFPGLLYLSTYTYLRRGDPAFARFSPGQESFFLDLLQAHELAHQWWGNVVTSAGYHDEWLMEALANHSALLYLENRDGRKALDAALERYRNQLLAKNENNQTAESAGPIIFGQRLESSQTPTSWNSITYGKGSWILHMLRSLMGDERFIRMLAELRNRYEWKTINTEQFRQLAAEFLPPKSPDPKLENFFEQWVYGTGIPNLKLSYSIHGKPPALKLDGTLSQTEVEPEFSAQVPVDIQYTHGKTTTWVRSSSSPVEFTLPLEQAPLKVSLDCSSVLAVHK